MSNLEFINQNEYVGFGKEGEDLEIIDPTTDQKRIIDLFQPLAEAAWEVISENQTNPDCIAATRAAICIIDQLGVTKSYGIMVSSVAMNAKMVQIISRMGRMPQNDRENKAWFEGTGAHSVGFKAHKQDSKSKNTVPQGHVVAVFTVGGNHYMMDIAIAQASRPKHKLTLNPLVVPIPENFLKGKEPGAIQRDDDNEAGKLIHYTAYPTVIPFAEQADWINIDANSTLVDDIITVYTKKMADKRAKN